VSLLLVAACMKQDKVNRPLGDLQVSRRPDHTHAGQVSGC
jgi:hypothetical protein